MKNKELIAELEERFKKIQKELKFKASLDELDSIFFIRDAVLDKGFISSNFSRQLCGRIVETYMSWNAYLHNLVVFPPGNMIMMTEGKMFSQEEKNNLVELIKGAMALISVNQLVGVSKDKVEEAKFIDDALDFWNSKFKEELIKITKKINEGWNKK